MRKLFLCVLALCVAVAGLAMIPPDTQAGIFHRHRRPRGDDYGCQGGYGGCNGSYGGGGCNGSYGGCTGFYGGCNGGFAGYYGGYQILQPSQAMPRKSEACTCPNCGCANCQCEGKTCTCPNCHKEFERK